MDGNNYTFTNASTVNSGSLTYLWNFGDGSATSALTYPSHTYASAGVYTVILTATAASGCTSSFTQIVTVIGVLFTGSLAGLPFNWIGAPGADCGTPSNWRVLSSGYYYIPSLIPTYSFYRLAYNHWLSASHSTVDFHWYRYCCTMFGFEPGK